MTPVNLRDLLVEAIEGRCCVRLSRSGDPLGAQRIGQPHILYESSAGNLIVDLYQTDGYSNTRTPPMWTAISVRDIRDASLMNERFEVNPQFNPYNRRRYGRIIASVTT